MYGSRYRENLRRAVRDRERSTANAWKHVAMVRTAAETKRKLVPQLQENLEQLRKRMKACRGPNQISEYLELKQEASQLDSNIKEILEDREAHAFVERALPLLVTSKTAKAPGTVDLDPNTDQKREALAMSIYHPEKAVPVFIQTDRCTHCGHDLEMKNEESLSVCSNVECHRITRVLQMSNDYVDLEQVGQDNHPNHIRSTATGQVDPMAADAVPAGFPKVSLYVKFLAQFSDKLPDPPEKVFETIMQELNKVHICHDSKVQPTPIGNILRRHNLKDYAFMSQRIAMLIRRRDNEPRPVMRDELIRNLEQRFRLLLRALTKSRSRNRKKVFNFKFLTKVFLVMEGEHALAELFENHKTRSVLRREDRRVGEGVRILISDEELANNGFSWVHFRSL